MLVFVFKESQDTALTIASDRGHNDVVSKLAEAGAYINHQNKVTVVLHRLHTQPKHDICVHTNMQHFISTSEMNRYWDNNKSLDTRFYKVCTHSS